MKLILRFIVLILLAPWLMLIWGIIDLLRWLFENNPDYLLKNCIPDLIHIIKYGFDD